MKRVITILSGDVKRFDDVSMGYGCVKRKQPPT